MSDEGTTPEIGGRRPIPIMLEGGKSYWWCACGRSKSPPFCDGSHKNRFQSGRIQARSRRRGLVLRLQTLGQETNVRRQSQKALMNASDA